MNRVKIISTGYAVPDRILTNADLEKMVDTSDEWITTRTGIKERRISSDKQASSDLGTEAAKKAMDAAKISPEDVGALIVTTISPDYLTPSTACVVQKNLGLKNAFCFDLSAACTGFVFGVAAAESLILTGKCNYAIVIAAETLTKFTDWTDRGTCILFGDGAGAAVLGKSDDESGFISFHMGGDGKYGDHLITPGGGSRNPASRKTVDERQHFMKMKGNEVFKMAVQKMSDSALIALERAGLTGEDVKLLIPHQANLRIIEAVRRRLNLKKEQVFVNIEKLGNMSAATVAVGLAQAVENGQLQKGDIVCLAAFGAGFTWGATVLKW